MPQTLLQCVALLAAAAVAAGVVVAVQARQTILVTTDESATLSCETRDWQQRR